MALHNGHRGCRKKACDMCQNTSSSGKFNATFSHEKEFYYRDGRGTPQSNMATHLKAITTTHNIIFDVVS